MGIQGLLRNLHPLLVPPPSHHSHQNQITANDHRHDGSSASSNRKKNATNIRHNIRQFQHKSLAIDASSWLHKAAYTCAERLVESTESGKRDPIAEQLYTKYMIDRCTELLNWFQIQTIYLVFDGKRVPLKAGTNAEREMKRNSNLEEARRLKAVGKYSEASEKYRSCVKGNDLMARVVAAEVEKKWGRGTPHTDRDTNGIWNKNVRVQCIWSPYEADAQLAKLCIDGYAHAVVTEDSDVLVYSAVTRKPFPIIYKLDRKDGSCDVLTMDWLVNPEFLASGTGVGGIGSKSRGRGGRRSTDSGCGSSCSSARRGKRRREDLKDDLDYIYRDNPLLDDESESKQKNDSKEVNGGTDGEGNDTHCCCITYEDLGFAPVRRTLPPPTSPSSRKSNSTRAGKNSKSTAASDSYAGNTLLSYLRFFAYKEASNQGFGVRLFVQACVLSGCDYVPNRLSKVGPVTAFKLVKEASHRDAAIRFERVLKSLPAGSKLLAEECDKRSEEGDEKNADDDDDDGDDGDFLSLPDTDRNAKVKYEELLSKSESVFYYHLVREISTGRVLPLVAHNQPTKTAVEDDQKGEVDSLELDERLRPCITRFQEGMTFVGTAAEAMNDRPEPLLEITATTFQHHRPVMPSQKSINNRNHNSTDGGWILAKRHTASTQPIQTSFQKTEYRNFQLKKSLEAIAPLTKATPKKMPMQMYLKHPAVSETNKTAAINNKPLNIVKDNKTDGKLFCDDLRDASCDNISSGKENHDRNFSSTSSAANQFAGLAYGGSTENGVAKITETVPTSSYCSGHKPGVKSPFFSPVKFDYGLDTPHGQNLNCTKPENDVYNVPCELRMGDHDDGDERKQQNQITTIDIHKVIVDANSSSNFGLIGTVPLQMSNFYSPEIHFGPRRVSTSPPQKMNNMSSRDCSSEDVIEIFDDDDADEEEASSSMVVPLCEKRDVNPSHKSVNNVVKSNVNKRPFKSPFIGAMTNTRTSNNLSSLSYSKKHRPSSSALLAGFARQKKTSNIPRQKSSFFPTMAKSSTKQTQLSLKPFLTNI